MFKCMCVNMNMHICKHVDMYGYDCLYMHICMHVDMYGYDCLYIHICRPLLGLRYVLCEMAN